jgi:hypothetical protein
MLPTHALVGMALALQIALSFPETGPATLLGGWFAPRRFVAYDGSKGNLGIAEGPIVFDRVPDPSAGYVPTRYRASLAEEP